MKLSAAVVALTLALVASGAAQAAIYQVTFSNNQDYYDPTTHDEISGTVTVVGDEVTSFLGTAQGFDGDNSHFDGPLTLSTDSATSGFDFDNKWVGGADGVDNRGLLLTNGSFFYRIYDYTDQYHDYGLQAAWFGQSASNPVTLTYAAAPGASGPKVGLGLLPALAAMMGLAFTRGRQITGALRRATASAR